MNTTKRDVQDEKLYFMQNFDNDKKVTRIVIEATIISFTPKIRLKTNIFDI